MRNKRGCRGGKGRKRRIISSQTISSGEKSPSSAPIVNLGPHSPVSNTQIKVEPSTPDDMLDDRKPRPDKPEHPTTQRRQSTRERRPTLDLPRLFLYKNQKQIVHRWMTVQYLAKQEGQPLRYSRVQGLILKQPNKQVEGWHIHISDLRRPTRSRNAEQCCNHDEETQDPLATCEQRLCHVKREENPDEDMGFFRKCNETGETSGTGQYGWRVSRAVSLLSDGADETQGSSVEA